MNRKIDSIRAAKILLFCLIASPFLSFMYFLIFFGIKSEELYYWPVSLFFFLVFSTPWLLGSIILLIAARSYKNKNIKFADKLSLLSSAVSALGIFYFIYLGFKGVG